MNANGWIRAELVIAAFVIFGALHVLSGILGIKLNPFFIFLITLAILFLVGIYGDVLASLRKKSEKTK